MSHKNATVSHSGTQTTLDYFFVLSPKNTLPTGIGKNRDVILNIISYLFSTTFHNTTVAKISAHRPSIIVENHSGKGIFQMCVEICSLKGRRGTSKSNAQDH